MSEARSASPFDPRMVLGLLLFGALAFVALLYLIGSGRTGDDVGKADGHVAGTGLDGYAAFARYLEARGTSVRRVQSEAALDRPGLLVLTPPLATDGKELTRIVERRRDKGPTLVITPKWRTLPAALFDRKAKPGWVMLRDAAGPAWPDFHDELSVDLGPMRAGGQTAAWRGGGEAGALPVSESVASGKGGGLVPLVVGAQDGRVLAAYLADGGDYPELAALAPGPAPEGDDETIYPVILVFEPDLVNNFGFADAANARLAGNLVRAALDGSEDESVSFDLTFNGYARSANLLTLAFKPPFLAATLSLLLAALAVGWRAFNRFGPPLLGSRAIAFGKRALVSNAAGLMRRSKRMRLAAAPYADAARERLAHALGVPARADAAGTEAAIDRALAARQPDAQPFSAVAARLRAATRPTEILHAAQDLHALERTLTR